MSHGGDAPIRPGEILAGKYRVEKVLGQGAMGVVVAAMHVELHERRAIKFMLPSMLDDAEGVERFLREARAAVRLKSQHVAKIHDIGRLETGAPYMVMEYLEGSDLKHLLDTRGALPIPEAVTYLLQACEALAEAHSIGVVHRDLKPANLFVTRGANGAPCIKVLDFGIAKVIGGPEGVDMTKTSALLGTPLYMSPEQMRGARNVDGRSDVWALGAILYRMLTGKTPFSGSSVTEVCAAVVADQPDPPAMLRSEVHPALEAAVMRCLEKNPAKRCASAQELAAAIAPFASPQAAAPPSHTAPYAAAPAAAVASQSWPGAPQVAQMKPALAGTAILDPSFAVPSAVSPAAARPPPAPPPPVASAPAIAPPPAIAPAPAVAPPAAAQSTAAGATWTEAKPAPAKSSAGLIALIGAGVLLIAGGGAFAAMYFSGRGATAAAPTTQPAAPTTPPAVTATATASTEASATASAEPTASATATATATSAAAPAATPARPVARPKAKEKDAFGNDRK